MRTVKITLLTLIIISMGISFLPAQEGNYNILPLGPSKHKYKIEKIEKDQVIDTASGEAVSIEDIVERNPKTKVFIIGEQHDNYQCHAFQRDFIEALHKKHPKVIVGFEFFKRGDNERLNRYILDEIDEKTLLEENGWYKRGGFNYGYTRMIMELLKKNKIKAIGLNVPRTILRGVSRKGFDSLSAEEKKLFPTLGIPNAEHEYFIKSIFGTFAAQVPMWFTNIYAAQRCWDVIMAESMRVMLAKKEYRGYKGVIIAGSNHVAYRLGIPFRYRKASPKASTLTIMPISVLEKKEESGDEEAHPMMRMLGKSLAPAATFSRGIADVVFAALRPEHPYYPRLGFSVKESEGVLTVSRVEKKSIAAKNGIAKGDRIIAVDDVPLKTAEQMRLLLAKKAWGDSAGITVAKTVEIKKDGKEKQKKEKKDKKEKKEKKEMKMPAKMGKKMKGAGNK